MKTLSKAVGAAAAFLVLSAPSLAVLKPGAMLVPFSLKSVDGKDYSVSVEDGRLTLAVAATVDGKTTVVKSRPALLLVDFWATYCIPCRKAMPHMQQLHAAHGPAEGQAEGGLRVIGIALDEAGSKVVRPFYEKLKITYPILADPPSVPAAEGAAGTAKDMKKRYGVQGIPVVYLIDSSGTIVHAHVGSTDEQMAELDRAVAALLGGGKR
jgi:thiol-disulfide isomerase/thioredoxin